MLTLRNAAWLVAFLTAATAGSLLAMAWLMSGREFYHDFRGQALPAVVRLSGPQVGRFAKVEPDGLAIALPKDRRDRGQVGFAIPMQVRGDFEVTATFHVVQAETPLAGYGVGPMLGVDDRARLGHMARPRGEQVILWDFWPVVDGVRTMEGDVTPCISNEGRLRLKRSGSVLHYLWSADVTGDDFQEINAVEYGLDDTKFFTFVAESSGQPCAVEVRLLELQIRPLVAAVQPLRWAAAASAGAGMLMAAALWGLSALRRKRAQPAGRVTANSNGPPPASSPAPIPDAIHAQCPSCGKGVKVHARAAGKKVKCPGCAGVFVAGPP